MRASPGPIRTDEFASENPYGNGGSRGCDVWDAIEAARLADLDALRALVARDGRLARYCEPLLFAVRGGHLPVVMLLAGAGADLDALGSDNETLVTMARERGHHHVGAWIEEARSSGTRVRPIDRREPDHPIHMAAFAGAVDRVRAMLDVDPSLARRGDRKGGTPLHRAVLGGQHAMIDLLIDRGADVNARHGAGPGDAAGYAAADFEPIDLALFWHGRGDIAMARRLIARGAHYDLTIAAALGDIEGVGRMLDEDPGRIREARPSGRRPLSAAVELGHETTVELLLDRGADPNWPEGADGPRGLALHAAASAGNRALVEILLDHGADPNANVDSAGTATGAAATPELRALLVARGGWLDCYDLAWLDEDDEIIRRVRENPRAADVGCGGVFTVAATKGKRDFVRRLFEAGARVPPAVTGCRSYLLENPEILRLLLANGMDPDLPNWQRATPLHDLCGRDGRGRSRAHRTTCATILLEAGANISAKDEEYRSTPLAWAARTNLPDMVDFLLDRGAPANLPDDEPWATPLAWAIARGHREIEDTLRAGGATA